MTEHRAIEAKRWHVGRILRTARPEDLAMIGATGINGHRELAAVFNQSSYRRAWEVDGRLAGLGGVMGTMASSEGFLWLVLTADAVRHPRAILADGCRHLDEILGTYRDLTTAVFRGDDPGLRFATYMGFRPRQPHIYGDFILMERRRDLPQAPVLRGGAEARPFVVHGLPRSRTTWVAEFLTYGGWWCEHDAATFMRTVPDIAAYFRHKRRGACETGALPGWRILAAHVPGLRTAVIRRPVDDVMDSLMGLPVPFDRDRLYRIITHEARAMEEIAHEPGVLVLEFDDLTDESACAALFEHCLPFEHDPAWWRSVAARNIQIDMAQLVAYRNGNRERIDDFKKACKVELRRMVQNGYRRKPNLGFIAALAGTTRETAPWA